MLARKFMHVAFVVAMGLGVLAVAPAAHAEMGTSAPVPTCAGALLPIPAAASGGEVTGGDGQGVYVGDVFIPAEGNHGTLWDRDGFTDLGLGFLANDVNKHGVVVGDLRDDTSLDVTHAAVLRDGVRTPLPEPPGAIGSHVFDVNDQGDAVGDAILDEFGDTEAVAWPAATPGLVVPLSVPPGTTATLRADGVDDQGRIVGTALTSPFLGPQRGVVWRTDGSVLHELGQLVLGGSQFAAAISDGRVVGQVELPNGDFVPVEWGPDGVPTVLPSQGNDAPEAINHAGVIGGREFFGADGSGRVGPVLWVDGELVELPDAPGTSQGGITAVGDDHTAAGTEGPFPPRPTLWTCPGSLF